MGTWKACNIRWQSSPNDNNFVQLKLQNTREPKCEFEKLLNKLKKPMPRQQHNTAAEPDVLVREIRSRTDSSFVDSFFRQKSTSTFLANKYFSLGLTNTGGKCHVVANMSNNAPIYVYECKSVESHRYLDRCNSNQVPVNENDMKNHFNLREVTMSRNYVAQTDTTYFFVTVNPSFFMVMNIDTPFDGNGAFAALPTVVSTTEAGHGDHDNPTTNADDNEQPVETSVPLTVVRRSESLLDPSNWKCQHDVPVDSKDFVWFLEQKNAQILAALEQESNLLARLSLQVQARIRLSEEKKQELSFFHKLMCEKLKYMEQVCANKDKELMVLEGKRQREMFFLKRSYEEQLRDLRNRMLKETDARVKCELEIALLQERHESDQEIIEQLRLVCEDLERKKDDLTEKINAVIKNLNIQ